MTNSYPTEARDDSNLAAVWLAFFAAPFAWTFNQGIAYAVMKPTCVGRASYVLWLIAAAALAMVVAGAWTGWQRLRQPDSTSDRTAFLASLTVAFNILIGLLIITAALPHFFLSPCE